MIEIKVENSFSQITGLNVEQYKELRGALSYSLDPQSAFFSGSFYGSKRYLLSKTGEFPTGLLYLVEATLRGHGWLFFMKDNRKAPEPLREPLKFTLEHPPYPEQKAAVEAFKKANRGVIVAPTGLGKSYIVAMLIEAAQVPTLVVVPTVELKRQLSEFLVSSFGNSSVGHIGSNRPIVVENIDALSTEKDQSMYSFVIIDEFHHAAANSYRRLNKKSWTNAFHRIGLTATAFRSKDNERLLLESFLSEVIYRIDYKTAVDKGYIVPVEAYYVDLPKQQVHTNRWPMVYSTLVVNNVSRNTVIAGLCLSLCKSHISHLCLVTEIKHGEALNKESGLPFVNGKDDNTKGFVTKFNAELIRGLIGTTGVLGEGVDTKPAEYVIIAGLGRSKARFMQQIGRGLRKSPGKESCKVIIFRDSSHKFTLRHYAAQCKILKEEYGMIPARIDL